MAAAGSLAEALAGRRAQLQQERTFVLPILGYEDLGLAARYRVLSYEELRKIVRANERLQDTAEGELVTAADTLIKACVGLVQLTGDGEEPVASGWTAQTAREWFGVELPEGATSRVGLRAVMPSTQLMLHFQAYDVELGKVTPEIDGDLQGESQASPAIAV